MNSLALIWAQAPNRVIGTNGTIPWHLPEDLAFFHRTTAGAPVIMGRKTWESLPARVRPLPGRTNIVVSRNPHYAAAGAYTVPSLSAAINAARMTEPETVFVMGGGQLYTEALPLADKAIVTTVDIQAVGDTLGPEIGEGWCLKESPGMNGAQWLTDKTGLRYRMDVWER